MDRTNPQRRLSCSAIGTLALLTAAFVLGVAASAGTLTEAAVMVLALAVVLALAWLSAWTLRTARGQERRCRWCDAVALAICVAGIVAAAVCWWRG